MAEADFVGNDLAIAEQALAAYDLPPASTLTLLNLSENATYAVEEPGTGAKSILRVHRKNYHRRHEIESELDWLDALRRDSDLTVPVVVPARDGTRVVTIDDEDGPRHVVHFEMVDGVARGLGPGDRRGQGLVHEVASLSRVYSRRAGEVRDVAASQGAL